MPDGSIMNIAISPDEMTVLALLARTSHAHKRQVPKLVQERYAHSLAKLSPTMRQVGEILLGMKDEKDSPPEAQAAVYALRAWTRRNSQPRMYRNRRTLKMKKKIPVLG